MANELGRGRRAAGGCAIGEGSALRRSAHRSSHRTRPVGAPSRSDSGAALVTVLVMLSIMAALAIVVVEAARFSILRTSNQQEMDQNRWYLMSAEAYAASKIENLRKAPDAARVDQD